MISKANANCLGKRHTSVCVTECVSVCVCVCHHNRPTFKTQQRSLYYNPCGKALTYEGRTMPITVRNPASLSFLNAIISGV